jgi:hypothetical protein
MREAENDGDKRNVTYKAIVTAVCVNLSIWRIHVSQWPFKTSQRVPIASLRGRERDMLFEPENSHHFVPIERRSIASPKIVSGVRQRARRCFFIILSRGGTSNGVAHVGPCWMKAGVSWLMARYRV